MRRVNRLANDFLTGCSLRKRYFLSRKDFIRIEATFYNKRCYRAKETFLTHRRSAGGSAGRTKLSL
jgi:hypothetical protein